jgi:urease alpha subunit
MLYNQANPHIHIDLRTADIAIDGRPLPALPLQDVPLNRRYFLL